MVEIVLAPSSDDWLQCVLDDFDTFLIDHAANERKASAMAMSITSRKSSSRLTILRKLMCLSYLTCSVSMKVRALSKLKQI